MSKNAKVTAIKKAEENKTTVNTTKTAEKKTTLKKVDDLSELQRELKKLKQENESLKKGKLKLSFIEAEKLYKRKSELLRQLARYEEKKQIFEGFNVSNDPTEILNTQNIRLSIEMKSEFDRWEDVFKTSSKLILGEFVPFIIEKLKAKIKEQTAEVETIDI